ncbi:hypothetical protein E2L07_18215 [Halalkalibacterium halodurans]|uniref:hypothetical protein n=1 Tax=Halalkalibacterium halodurans TaxID=86665 RepID=UPI0010687892|nr:hypothetical protein [Halalkalibacterium halodurans]TES48802.1 hypothetical protein E2L07_18215 [Halalkalibacterium halodurans]
MREVHVVVEANNSIRDLDPKRRYFISELEGILKKLKGEFRKNGRDNVELSFTLFIKNKRVLKAFIDFNDNRSLEESIYLIIKNASNWNEATKNKVINDFTDFLSKEKKLFLDQNFKLFAIEVEEQFSNQDFSFSLEKLKQLYDLFRDRIVGSFYSEVNDIAKAIKYSFDDLVLTQELTQESLNDVENFSMFQNYAVASRYSLPLSRLDKCLRDSEVYEEVQRYLFEQLALEDYVLALKKNKEIETLLKNRWYSIIKKGIVISSEDDIKNNIILPVLSGYLQNEQKDQKSEEAIIVFNINEENESQSNGQTEDDLLNLFSKHGFDNVAEILVKNICQDGKLIRRLQNKKETLKIEELIECGFFGRFEREIMEYVATLDQEEVKKVLYESSINKGMDFKYWAVTEYISHVTKVVFEKNKS